MSDDMKRNHSENSAFRGNGMSNGTGKPAYRGNNGAKPAGCTFAGGKRAENRDGKPGFHGNRGAADGEKSLSVGNALLFVGISLLLMAINRAFVGTGLLLMAKNALIVETGLHLMAKEAFPWGTQAVPWRQA